jgi:deoxyribodipyrimidine photolyase-related protein
MRYLNLVLGDQLDADSSLWASFDPTLDAVWMAEVREESTHVWSHRARIVMFLSAMRHFANELRARGFPVHYRALGEANDRDFAQSLQADLQRLRPQRVRFVWPGDFRVREALKRTLNALKVPFDELDDRHFLSTPSDFAEWAEGRRELRMEYFYRPMRKRYRVLMDADQPVGGQWNFDADNRAAMSVEQAREIPPPLAFAPDPMTREVIALVEQTFPDHPGSLAAFDWPVTARDAERALEDFVDHRLARFGEFQDALLKSQTYLHHSRLSAAMNLKLLDPRRVIDAVERAFRDSRVPLNSAEGFIRQILGWREYVRGLYWLDMPEYQERNALGAMQPLPRFFWTGETEMACLADTLQQTLEHGYAHHIQRLMVTGLYALLLGVEPKQIHAWYLAIYVDAVEWVELPNVIGMSQFADGGRMASKPYIASGKYIDRMSNYCAGCRFKPDQATGQDACPFTTLYWDFLSRHEQRFERHPRLGPQVRNVKRLSAERRAEIAAQAALHRQEVS